MRDSRIENESLKRGHKPSESSPALVSDWLEQESGSSRNAANMKRFDQSAGSLEFGTAEQLYGERALAAKPKTEDTRDAKDPGQSAKTKEVQRITEDWRAFNTTGHLNLEQEGKLFEAIYKLPRSEHSALIESLEKTGIAKDTIPRITYNRDGTVDSIGFGKDVIVNVPNENYPGTLAPGRVVNLDTSSHRVDQSLALRQKESAETFNCHYYTYMRTGQESESLRDIAFDNVIAWFKGFPDVFRLGFSGAGVQMNSEILEWRGFHRADPSHAAGTGDVIAVMNELSLAGLRFSVPEQLAYLHSGIVDRIEDGEPTVRQKLGPGRPVVDQTLENFTKTWAGTSNSSTERIHLWKPKEK
jgi:hypothetical protein